MTAGKKRSDAKRQVKALREALDVYVSGRSGISFDALVRFAGPIFDLYDVEWKAEMGAEVLQRDREELSTMVAILDSARLLWVFYTLDEEKSLELLPELEDVLIGRDAGDEERSNLLVLLSLLEEHWQSFTPEERAEAVAIPGYALPKFEDLLAEFAGIPKPLTGSGAATFGPDHLELPEALALFAQPLLESADVERDPDRLEEQIARAHAYWELAHASQENFDAELARIQDSFAANEKEREEIRRQAAEMIERFRTLFSNYPPQAS